jgi:molecular chaperone DnaK
VVEDAIAKVREAINANDTEAMKRTYEDLQNKFQEISADLYKQAAASAGSAGAGTSAGPEPQTEPQTEGPRKDQGDVVDAEFEVVDEDKK